MSRIVWKFIGTLILLCLFALVYFTIKIHDTLESRNDIELGFFEALHVVASRNYDSKEELDLKTQLEQKRFEHIHIYYNPVQQRHVPYIVEALDKARTENIRLIREYPTPSLDLILFQDSEQFYQYAQIRNTNGYYSDFDKIIGILPNDQQNHNPVNVQEELIDYIVLHEYSHYALVQRIQALGVPVTVPEWFLEGYAEYISFIHSEAIPLHISHDALIPFENLEKPKQWQHLRTAGAADIYRQSEEAIAYLIKEFGEEIIINILKHTGQSHSFEEALKQSTGLDYEELESRLLAR